MVCAGTDNADLDPVALVPSCETIDDIDSAAGVEVVDGTLSVDTPDLISIVSLEQAFSAACHAKTFSRVWPEDAGQRGRLGSASAHDVPNARICPAKSEAPFCVHSGRVEHHYHRTEGKICLHVTYLWCHGLVDGSPPDFTLRSLLFHNTLV